MIGRVDVDEAALLEELVYRRGGDAPDAEDGGEEVRARPEVLYRAQELHAVALLLQRVVGRGRALDLDGVRLELEGLLGLRREHELAADYERRADVLAGDLVVVGEARALEHDLQVAVRRAVVERDEAEVLHVAYGAGPAADGYLAAGKAGRVGVNGGNPLAFHGKIPPGGPGAEPDFKFSLQRPYVYLHMPYSSIIIIMQGLFQCFSLAEEFIMAHLQRYNRAHRLHAAHAPGRFAPGLTSLAKLERTTPPAAPRTAPRCA